MGSKIGEGDRLSPNKALLEIGVDLASRLGRLGSLLDGPGMRLLRTGSKKGHQAEKRITGSNDARETGLLKPERSQELALLAGVAELRQFGLDRGRDHHRARAARRSIFGNAAAAGVARGSARLIDIGDVKDR